MAGSVSLGSEIRAIQPCCLGDAAAQVPGRKVGWRTRGTCEAGAGGAGLPEDRQPKGPWQALGRSLPLHV